MQTVAKITLTKQELCEILLKHFGHDLDKVSCNYRDVEIEFDYVLDDYLTDKVLIVEIPYSLEA